MSTEVAKLTTKDIIFGVEKEFVQIAPTGINFHKEAEFALQILGNPKNSFLKDVALKNPGSLQNAVMNLSTIGLTLNPALKFAYLVPRDGGICLDISYMGLSKLATDTGSVLWVQAAVVYKKDDFKLQGHGLPVIHNYDPRSDRGEFDGAYCTAKLHNGDHLVTYMSAAEILKIKSRSEAGKKDVGPWTSDFLEMAKKCPIKQGSKLWPKTERLQKAIDIINEHEGIDFSKIADATPPSEELLSRLSLMLANIKDGTTRLLSHISAKDKVPVNRIEDLSAKQIEYSIEFLRPYIKTGETV